MFRLIICIRQHFGWFWSAYLNLSTIYLKGESISLLIALLFCDPGRIPYRAADTQPTQIPFLHNYWYSPHMSTQHSELLWPECKRCLQRSWIISVTYWALRRGRLSPARTRRPGCHSRGLGLVWRHWRLRLRPPTQRCQPGSSRSSFTSSRRQRRSAARSSCRGQDNF